MRLVASASLGPSLARGRLAWAGAAINARDPAAADIHPQNLRVEWRRAPLGIDTPRPRFTWTLAARSQAMRALEQRACQVIVASSPAAAGSGRGDIWDSGRLTTAEPRAVPDHDLPLASQTPYWWAVRVWDGRGGASAFSEPASFTDRPHERSRLARALDCGWARLGRLPRAAAGHQPRVRRCSRGRMPLLRREFRIDKPLQRAVLSLCGLGQHELRINGRRASASVLDPGWTDYRKTALYDTLEVSHLLRPGTMRSP